MSSNIENIMMNSKIQKNQPMDGEKREIRITSINKLKNYNTIGNKSENGKKRFNNKTNYQIFETNINNDKIKTIENSNYSNKRIYFKVTKNNSIIKNKADNSSKIRIIDNRNNKDLQNNNEERLYKYQINSNENNNLIKSACSNLKYKSNTNNPNKSRIANQNILLNENIINDLNTFVYNPFNDNNLYKTQTSENQFNIINQPISPLTLENIKFKKVKKIEKKSKIKEKIKYNSSNKLPQKIKRTNQIYFYQTESSEKLDGNLYNKPKKILQTINKDKQNLDPDNNNSNKFNYINSEKYNTLLTESTRENNNYIYEYLHTNITNDNNYNWYERMPTDTKENKNLFYKYLTTNNSIEIYNESNAASPSLKFNLKEVNNNYQKKENKNTVSYKDFQSFNTLNNGNSKKVSSIIKNNEKDQKLKEIQNYHPKKVARNIEEIYENNISNGFTENKQIKIFNSTKDEEIIEIKDNKQYFERIMNDRKLKELKNINNGIMHHIKTESIDNHNAFPKVEGKIYDYNLYNKNSFYDESKDKIIKNNSFGNSNNIINKTLTNKEKSVIINKKRNINLNSNKLNDVDFIMKQNLFENTKNDNIKKYNKSNPNIKTENAVSSYINKKFNKVFNIVDKNNFCNIKTCFKLWKNKSEKFNNIKKIDAKISELKDKLNNIDIWKKNKMNHFNMKDNKKDKTLSSDLLKNKKKIMTAKTLTYYENKNFYKSCVINNNINKNQYNRNKINNSNNNDEDINNGNSITPQIKKKIESRITNTDFINGNLNPKRSINNKKINFKTIENNFKSVNINKNNNIELINSKMVLGRLNNIKNRDSRITRGFKKMHFLFKNSKFHSKRFALKKIKEYIKTNKKIDGLKKFIKFYIKYKKSKIKKAFSRIRKYINKNKKIERTKKIYNYLANKIKFNKKNTFRILRKYIYSIKKIENTGKIYIFLVKIINYHKKSAFNKLKFFSNYKKRLQDKNNKVKNKNTNVNSISTNIINSSNNINSNELNSNNNITKNIGKKFLNNQIDSTTYSVRIQPTNSINLIASSPKENSCFTLAKNKKNKLEELFDDNCNPWTINIENWEVNQSENDSFYQSKNNEKIVTEKNSKSNGLITYTYTKRNQKKTPESTINGKWIQKDEKWIPNVNGGKIESIYQNKESERKKSK